MTDIEQNIKINADLANAISNINRGQAEFKKFKDQLDELAKAGKIAGREVGDAFSDKEARKYYNELKKVAKETERIEEETRRAARAAQDYGDAASIAAREVEAFGDVGSATSTIRGALESAGVGGPVTGALLAGGEISDSVEAVRRLGPALSNVKDVATETISSLAQSAGGFKNLGIAAAATGIAIGGAVALIGELNKKRQEESDRISTIIEGQSRYFETLAAGNITLGDAKNRTEELRRSNAALNAEARELQSALDDIEIEKEAERVRGFFGSLAGEEEYINRLEEVRRQIAANTAELSKYGEVLGGNILSGQQYIAAFADLQKETAAGAKLQADVQLQLAAARNQTADAVQQNIDRLADEIRIKEELRTTLDALGQDTSDVSAEIERMTQLQAGLRSEILPTLRAHEKQIEITDKLKEAATNFVDRVKERQSELASAVEDYNTDVADVQESTYEELAALQDKYNAAQVDAAEKLADDQEKLAEQLAGRIADLSTDLQRDNVKAQQELARSRIEAVQEAQKAEVEAARDHAKRLVEIRRDAAQAEEDAILARDFRKLFEIRRSTGRELEAEAEKFNEERTERRAELQENLSDLQQSFVEERAERQQDYQQKLADLRAANASEQADLRAAAQERQQELQASYAQERALREQAAADRLRELDTSIKRELQMIQMGQAERERLEAQFQQRMLAQANNILSGGLGGLSLATGGAGLSGFGGGFGGGILNNNNNVENNNNFNIPPQLNPEAIAGQIRDTVGGLIRGLIS